MEQACRAQEERTQKNGQHREPLSKPRSAQLACDHPRQDQDARAGDGREKANREQRVAKQAPGGFGQQRNGRREIHTPQAQVLAHGQIEKFIAVDSVGCHGDGKKMSEQLDGREANHKPQRRRGRGAVSGALTGASTGTALTVSSAMQTNARNTACEISACPHGLASFSLRSQMRD